MIAAAVGKVLEAVTEDRGFLVLYFTDGHVYHVKPDGLGLMVMREVHIARLVKP